MAFDIGRVPMAGEKKTWGIELLQNKHCQNVDLGLKFNMEWSKTQKQTFPDQQILRNIIQKQHIQKQSNYNYPRNGYPGYAL